MDYLSKKTLILIIVGVLIFILEIGIILNAYLTVKYKIEESLTSTEALNNLYSLIQIFSITLFIDLLIIVFLFVVVAKN